MRSFFYGLLIISMVLGTTQFRMNSVVPRARARGTFVVEVGHVAVIASGRAVVACFFVGW